MADDIQISSISIGVELDLADFNQTLAELQRQFSQPAFTLTITVDDGGLSDLGKTLNATRSQYQDLVNYFQSNPIAPKVDTSGIDGLTQTLSNLKDIQTDIQVNVGLDTAQFQRDLQGLQEQIGKTLTVDVNVAVNEGAIAGIDNQIKELSTNIEITPTLNESRLNEQIEELRERFGKSLSLTIDVDSTSLSLLNKRLNVSQTRFEQLNKLFAESPLRPDVDFSSLDELEKRLTEIRNATASVSHPGLVTQPASQPASPSQPKPTANWPLSVGPGKPKTQSTPTQQSTPAPPITTPSTAPSGISGVFSQVKTGIDALDKSVGSIIGVFFGFQSLSFVTSFFSGLEQNIEKTTLQFEKLEQRINSFSTSSATSFESIKKLAQQYSVDQQSFLTGAVSLMGETKGGPLEGAATQQMLKAIATTSKNRGFDQSEQQQAFGAFTGLSERGATIDDRKLREFNNALPGGMDTMARSLGTTTEGLQRMAREGSLLAEDVLPKLTQQMSAESGISGAANQSQASINRLSNSLQDMQVAVGKDLLPLKDAGLDTAAAVLNKISENSDVLIKSFEGLALVGASKLLPSLISMVGGMVAAQGGIGAIATTIRTVMLPAMAEIALQVAVFTAITDVFAMFGKAASDGGGKMREFANDSASALDKYRQSLADAKKGNEDFVSSLPKSRSQVKGASLLEDSLIGNVAGLIAGQTGKTFVRGAEQNIQRSLGLHTLAEKQAEDLQIAASDRSFAGNKIISDVYTQLGAKGQGADVIKELKDIDKQLDAVQSKRRAVLAQNPEDEKSLKQLQQQEDTLLKQRETKAKPVADLQAGLQQFINQSKAAQEELDKKAKEGAITSDDYKSASQQIKNDLDAAQKAQEKLNQSVRTGVDALGQLSRSLQSVADKLADANQALNVSTSNAKTAIANAEASGSVTRGQAQAQGSVVDQARLVAQIVAQTQAIAGQRALLNTSKNQQLLQTYGFDQSTGSAQLKTAAGQTQDPTAKKVFDGFANVKQLEEQTSQLQEQLASSQANIKEQLYQTNKQLADYYRDIQFSAEQIALTLKQTDIEVKTEHAKNTLKQAISGFQDNFISQFLDSIMSVMDIVKQGATEQLQASIQKLQENQNFQKFSEQNQEMGRTMLPGQVSGVNFSGSGAGVVSTGGYSIADSNYGNEVTQYTDLSRHHIKRGHEGTRQYAVVDGREEEVQQSDTGRTLVKKDMVLSKDGNSDNVSVPSPAAGYIWKDPTYAKVKIFADPEFREQLGEVLHMKSYNVKTGDHVQYGQALGLMGGLGSNYQKEYDPHAHIALLPQLWPQFIKDMRAGNFDGVKQQQYVCAICGGTNHSTGDHTQAANKAWSNLSAAGGSVQGAIAGSVSSGTQGGIPNETLALIKHSEGYSSRAYQDPGDVPTIGWGSTWQGGDGKTPVQLGMQISKEQAQQWMIKELQSMKEEIRQSLPNFDNYSSGQQAAIQSFYYQHGAGSKKFNFWKTLQGGGDSTQAAEQLRYSTEGGARPYADRRNLEADIWEGKRSAFGLSYTDIENKRDVPVEERGGGFQGGGFAHTGASVAGDYNALQQAGSAYLNQGAAQEAANVQARIQMINQKAGVAQETSDVNASSTFTKAEIAAEKQIRDILHTQQSDLEQYKLRESQIGPQTPEKQHLQQTIQEEQGYNDQTYQLSERRREYAAAVGSARAGAANIRGQLQAGGLTPEQTQYLQRSLADLNKYGSQTEVALKNLDKIIIDNAGQHNRKMKAIAEQYAFDESGRRLQAQTAQTSAEIQNLKNQQAAVEAYQKNHPGDFKLGDPLEIGYKADSLKINSDYASTARQITEAARGGSITPQEATARRQAALLNMLQSISNLDQNFVQSVKERDVQLAQIALQYKAESVQTQTNLQEAAASAQETYQQRHPYDNSKYGDAISLHYQANVAKENLSYDQQMQSLDEEATKTAVPERLKQIEDIRKAYKETHDLKLAQLAETHQNQVADYNQQQKDLRLGVTQQVEGSNINLLQAQASLAQGQGLSFRSQNFARTAAYSQQAIDYSKGSQEIDKLAQTGQYTSQQIQQLRSNLESLNDVKLKGIDDQFNELKPTLDTIQKGTQSFFSDIITGSKSVGDAFKGLMDSIFKSVTDLLTQKLTQSLLGGLFGGQGQQGGGFLGGLFGKGASIGGAQGGGQGGGLLSGLGSIFGGGGSSGGGSSGGGGIGDIFGSLLGGGGGGGGLGFAGSILPIFGLAEGGPVPTVVPTHHGYSTTVDTVPAMVGQKPIILAGGEGILTHAGLTRLGGPIALESINRGYEHHFAAGGITPLPSDRVNYSSMSTDARSQTPSTLSIETHQVGEHHFVTVDQLHKATQAAADHGAQRGATMVFQKLSNSPGARRSVGL